MPAYLYWGEEDFNLEKAVRELRNNTLDENFVSLNHKKLDEPDIAELIETLQTLPMMFGNLFVEVKATTLFLRGNKKVNSSDSDMQRLLQVIENLNDRVHLLFVCPIPRDSGKKVDSVIKLTKLVQKVGKVQEFPAYKFYEDYKVVEWIIKQAASKSLKISKDSAAILFSSVGMELRKLDIELEKLKTAVHPKNQITTNDLSDIVSTSENIFILIDFLIKGQKIEAIKELHKLFDRNNPLKILATIQTMTRRWLKIIILSKKHNAFDISKMVNSPKFTVEKDLEKLKNVSEERLIELREKAVQTEYKIKKGTLPPEEAMELLIMG